MHRTCDQRSCPSRREDTLNAFKHISKQNDHADNFKTCVTNYFAPTRKDNPIAHPNINILGVDMLLTAHVANQSRPISMTLVPHSLRSKQSMTSTFLQPLLLVQVRCANPHCTFGSHCASTMTERSLLGHWPSLLPGSASSTIHGCLFWSRRCSESRPARPLLDPSAGTKDGEHAQTTSHSAVEMQ